MILFSAVSKTVYKYKNWSFFPRFSYNFENRCVLLINFFNLLNCLCSSNNDQTRGISIKHKTRYVTKMGRMFQERQGYYQRIGRKFFVQVATFVVCYRYQRDGNGTIPQTTVTAEEVCFVVSNLTVENETVSSGCAYTQEMRSTCPCVCMTKFMIHAC